MRYRELLEAQKNNAEFMALSQRVTDLEKQLRNKTREKDEESKKRYRLEAEIEQKKKDSVMYQAKEAEEQKHLEEEQQLNRSAAEQAISCCCCMRRFFRLKSPGNACISGKVSGIEYTFAASSL